MIAPYFRLELQSQFVETDIRNFYQNVFHHYEIGRIRIDIDLDHFSVIARDLR